MNIRSVIASVAVAALLVLAGPTQAASITITRISDQEAVFSATGAGNYFTNYLTLTGALATNGNTGSDSLVQDAPPLSIGSTAVGLAFDRVNSLDFTLYSGSGFFSSAESSGTATITLSAGDSWAAVGSSGGLATGTGYNGNFGSWQIVSPVPIPAAAWLFGSALLGLGVVKRKRA